MTSKIYPDPTRNKKYFYWKDTYDFTISFFNKNTHLKRGAEIGVAGGQNIKHLLENCSHIEKLYGIDSYSPDSFDMKHINVNKEFGSFEGLFKEVNLMLSQFGDRTQLIRKTSSDALKEFLDESLDFIFLDANHEFDSVYSDISSWFPKIKKGGIFMGHDWDHGNFPGTTKAVKKYFANIKIETFSAPYHIWYVVK
jgi:predicted O-methyltransferase YrrM